MRPSTLGLALAATVVAVSAWASVAPAQAPQHVTARFWSELSDAGATRASQLVSQALMHVEQARRTLPGDWLTICRRTTAITLHADNAQVRNGRMRALRELLKQALERRAHLDNAIARLEAARALRPDDPDVLFTLTRVLSMWEQPGPLWGCASTRRDEEAVEILEHLQRIDPQYLSSEVALELGLIHTRQRHFREAATNYARAAALSLDRRNISVTTANLAEVTMLAGDLDHALLQYEHAIELASGGRDFLLALWGLAVALDRLGEHDAAVEHARRAITGEGGRMRVLRSDGVFFEPPHEIQYYEALGHEALAQIDEQRAAEELTAAAASWRAYLAGSDDYTDAPHHDDFRAAAAANLERLLSAERNP